MGTADLAVDFPHENSIADAGKNAAAGDDHGISGLCEAYRPGVSD